MRERQKVLKSGTASNWIWYEPMSSLEDCSGSNTSLPTVDSSDSSKVMLNPDKETHRRILPRMNSSPTPEVTTDMFGTSCPGLSQDDCLVEQSMAENLPSSNNIDASSSMQRTPKKSVVKVEKNDNDISTLAFEHLQKSLEREKDFAYGIGLAVENHLRSLSFEGRVKVAAKIMALLRTSVNKS